MRHRSTREHELPDTASRTRQELSKLSFAMTRTTPLHSLTPAGSVPLTAVPAAAPRLVSALPALSEPTDAVRVNGPGSAAPVENVADMRTSKVMSLLVASS